jgi:serine/threonine-protein kinase
VALKTLHERLAGDPERLARFEKEARTVASLNHPNIVTIYSVERVDELYFLAMEFVDGPTLAELIPEGGFRPDRYFEIAIPLLDAVCAAHDRSVVHRDLKPRNIMVNRSGLVKVLDFGVALLLTPDAPPGGEDLETRTLELGDWVFGTLQYTSPEQITGQPGDGRSDVFSLGIILYEMATGRQPFEGDTAPELISSILRDDPPLLTELNPTLPFHLARIVRHALQKDPWRRFQTVLELRSGIAGTREGFLASELGRAPWDGGTRGLSSVAVLPMDNLSGDPQQEYLADGMTEALITDLARIGALKIISRTSVMRYKNLKKPMREIANELGVDVVVEGSVLKVGERVQVSARLIDAEADRHLWAERYERKLQDVLSLQGEITRTIARKIEVRLTPSEETRLSEAPAVDPEAHEHYLRGRFLWNQRTPESVSRALAHFRRAIRIDPDYAPAHAGLADCYILDEGAYISIPSRKAYALAMAAAQKALELDDTLAEAHTSLGAVLTDWAWDWTGAETEFERAIALNPNYVTARHWFAVLLAKIARTDEALAAARAARVVDPLSAVTSGFITMMLYFAREYDRAVDESRRTLELDPSYAWGHCLQGLSYVRKGSHDRAIVALRRAVEYSGNMSGFLAYLGYGYAAAGNLTAAREILGRLAWRPDEPNVSPLDIAIVHAALGEVDRALEWFREAFQKRSDKFGYLNVDPMFDELRKEPRFQELLLGMNIPARPASKTTD